MSKIQASEVSAQALKKSRKGRLISTVVWALILLAGFGAWFIAHPKMVAAVIAVKRGPVIKAVYGTLQVEPVTQTIVKSQSSGILTTVKVKKGDVVKEGDPLAEINDTMALQELAQAQTDYDHAVKAREIGPPSQVGLDAKRRLVEQLSKLLKDGNISQAEYDTAFTETKALEERVKTEQLGFDTAVQAAKQRLDAAKKLDKQRTILAPQDGVILDFYAQLGQLVQVTNQIFLVGSQECQIHAKVNEEDVGVLKPDMAAEVKLYSYSSQTFKAKVKDILTFGVLQEYGVILSLEASPEHLFPGMTGELHIIVDRREGSLVIPSRALCVGAAPTVLVVEGGMVQSRHVQIGYRSIDSAEITSGLAEGDLVIVDDQDLYKPGQRVVAKQL